MPEKKTSKRASPKKQKKASPKKQIKVSSRKTPCKCAKLKRTCGCTIRRCVCKPKCNC